MNHSNRMQINGIQRLISYIGEHYTATLIISATRIICSQHYQLSYESYLFNV